MRLVARPPAEVEQGADREAGWTGQASLPSHPFTQHGPGSRKEGRQRPSRAGRVGFLVQRPERPSAGFLEAQAKPSGKSLPV